MSKNKKNSISKYLVSKYWKKIIKVFTTEQKLKIVPIVLSDILCFYCGMSNVSWKNVLTFDYSCSECVPRGCSCRLYKASERNGFSVQDYKYELDEDGKELPCEDWERL